MILQCSTFLRVSRFLFFVVRVNPVPNWSSRRTHFRQRTEKYRRTFSLPRSRRARNWRRNLLTSRGITLLLSANSFRARRRSIYAQSSSASLNSGLEETTFHLSGSEISHCHNLSCKCNWETTLRVSHNLREISRRERLLDVTYLDVV